MHFNIEGTELDLIQKTALEQDLTLGDSLGKLIRLGHCTKTGEHQEAILSIDTLEGVLDRLRNLKVVSHHFTEEIQLMVDEAKKIL